MAGPRNSLTFRLAVEDGWPPVAAECLPVVSSAHGYRLETAPLFVRGLSVGDVIAVTELDQEQVWSWTHISVSRHSTVWLLRTGSIELDPILGKLRGIGCGVTGLEQFGAYALDVPPSVPAANLDEVLSSADPSRLAVAYPSWRHGGSDA